jgi:hypothetical protein
MAVPLLPPADQDPVNGVVVIYPLTAWCQRRREAIAPAWLLSIGTHGAGRHRWQRGLCHGARRDIVAPIHPGDVTRIVPDPAPSSVPRSRPRRSSMR